MTLIHKRIAVRVGASNSLRQFCNDSTATNAGVFVFAKDYKKGMFVFDQGSLHRPVTLIFEPVVDADPTGCWTLMRPEEGQTRPPIAGVGNLLCSMQSWFRLPAADGNSGQRRHEWMGTNRNCRSVGGWESGKEEIVVSYWMVIGEQGQTLRS